MKKEKSTSSRKRKKERETERGNKQTEQVVDVTYQGPLFFPSFHAFLEAL